MRAPALTSAESIAAAAPGRWIYRVAAETILVHESPSPAAAVVGRRARGDFVRGIELRDTAHSGPWLRLDGEGSVEAAAAAGGRRGGGGYGDDDEDYDDDEEDEEDDGYGGGGGAYGGAAPWRFYNAELRRKPGAPHLWVRLQGTAEDDGPLVVRVDASDAPHVHEASVVEGEVRDDAGSGAAAAAAAGAAAPPPQRRLDSLAAEFLDAPFVPQVLPGEGAVVGCRLPPTPTPFCCTLRLQLGSGDAAASTALALPPGVDLGAGEASLLAEALASSGGAGGGSGGSAAALPLGAAVVVQGLAGAASAAFNGVSGIVISPLSGGRQGVSGSLRPLSDPSPPA